MNSNYVPKSTVVLGMEGLIGDIDPSHPDREKIPTKLYVRALQKGAALSLRDRKLWYDAVHEGYYFFDNNHIVFLRNIRPRGSNRE